MATRRRLDRELRRRGLVDSEHEAGELIDAHRVTVNGAVAAKTGHLVAAGDSVEVLAPPARFVGRGGDKLERALDRFGLDVAGWRCVDVGSSTGGFTDCLLQRGAASVVAIDVGRAQLHERLRADPRVDVREQTDVRGVDAAAIGGPFDLAVVDVSFIGLAQVLDIVSSLVGPGGWIVALVKPQFEADRTEVDKGQGVIRDEAIWRRVLDGAVQAARSGGLTVGGVEVSPIKGAAGNVEFFVVLGGVASGVPDTVDANAVNAAVTRARALP